MVTAYGAQYLSLRATDKYGTPRFVPLTKYHLGDEIEEDELGWIYEMHTTEEKYRQYRRGTLK